MSANILNSERAIKVSILIVETFIQMRKMLMNNEKMASKLREIEDRMDTHEMNTIIIMDKLRSIYKKKKKKAKIGFNPE